MALFSKAFVGSATNAITLDLLTKMQFVGHYKPSLVIYNTIIKAIAVRVCARLDFLCIFL